MSLIQNRGDLARQVSELWLKLKAGERRSGEVTDEEREAAVVERLLELFAEDIFEVLNHDPVSRLFCGIWVVVDHKNRKAGWAGDARVLRAGVVRALHTRLKNPQLDIVSLIRTSIAEELINRRDERIKMLRSRKAEDILPVLLELVRRNQHDNAAAFVNHLTGPQRSDLKALLHDRLSGEPVIFLRMDRGPEEPRMWLFWYLWRLSLIDIKEQEQLGGIPLIYPALRRDALPFDKEGYPRDPLGPIHAKVYQKLGRMLPHHPKRDPKSKSTVAASLRVQKDAKGVNRSVLERYLKADVPVTITPNGEDRVDYTFTAADILASIKTVCGEKRGPKPKNS